MNIQTKLKNLRRSAWSVPMMLYHVLYLGCTWISFLLPFLIFFLFYFTFWTWMYIHSPHWHILPGSPLYKRESQDSVNELKIRRKVDESANFIQKEKDRIFFIYIRQLKASYRENNSYMLSSFTKVRTVGSLFYKLILSIQAEINNYQLRQ